MTAMAYGPYSAEDALLEGFLKLQTPEGFRAELLDGEIIVSPPRGGHHERVISRVLRQVQQNSKIRMDFSGNRGLVVPRGGQRPNNHVIPDGLFAPFELDLFNDDESYMPPDGVAMVVEVTSSRPNTDREAKRHCYARGGIPVYLLVDRERGTVTSFSEPKDDDYSDSHTVAFGKTIALPAPFGFELDTAEFA